MKHTINEEVIGEAKAERGITAASLLQEIEPLIREYFILNADYAGDGLALNFHNGQKFVLKAQEV